MPFSFQQLLWLFLIYAFLGWCTEVAYAAVNSGKFVNRGMANGSVCPIYGFGVLIVLLCLTPLKENFILLFLGSVVLTSALEFVTGWALETIFHDKWWDYSNQPFNIKGYVCLRFSLAWGLACLLVVNVIHPPILFLVNRLDNPAGYILLAVLFAMFLTDEVITFIHLLKLPRRLRAIEETEKRLREVSDGIGSTIADHVLDAVEKEQAFMASDRGRELLEKQAQLKSGTAELKERAKTMAAQEVQARKDELQKQTAQLELQFQTARKQFDESMIQNNAYWAEVDRLKAKYNKLVSQKNLVHERLMLAFPALQEGTFRSAKEKILKSRDARRQAKK